MMETSSRALKTRVADGLQGASGQQVRTRYDHCWRVRQAQRLLRYRAARLTLGVEDAIGAEPDQFVGRIQSGRVSAREIIAVTARPDPAKPSRSASLEWV
jgi:hypothetical protein